MSEYQHRARKRFGQNFLHDAGSSTASCAPSMPVKARRLLEIGPGPGRVLTEGLLGSGAQLDVIELDLDLIPILQAALRRQPRFRLKPGRRPEVRFPPA